VTGDSPTTLVWLAPDPPDSEQRRALSSWAGALGMRLVDPTGEHPPALAVDATVADEVETLLEHARDAIAARDAEAAERATASAEAALRAHAELPQASWLMAEVERVRSARWRRVPPTDLEAAERALTRADALDGGRSPGIGEVTAGTRPLDATVVVDVAAEERAWFDGAEVSAGAITTHAGLHALVVTWEGAPVWATWIETPAGSSTAHVEAPRPPPCSSGDVSQARLEHETLHADHVRCASWAAATPGERKSSVRVMLCEDDRCGHPLDWSAPGPWTQSSEQPGAATHTARRGWPAWATWGLVGTGAVLAAGAALLVSGALQSAPTESRFVQGRITPQ
jgi:hypothetical protein